jgi:hypothetical protein
MNTICSACGRGFTQECTRKIKCKVEKPDAEVVILDLEGDSGQEPQQLRRGSTYGGLKDPQSTGRKRAARLYPIDPEKDCEWQGRKNCGGGRFPIIGCVSGKQRDRHHGPVKNTTRNQQGNVHRICKSCHNHWHELNDIPYNELDYGLLPHDPVAASQEELVLEEVAWITGQKGKDFILASSVNKKKLKLGD